MRIFVNRRPVRLRHAAPTLPESIMVEVDRCLVQLVSGWLLTPVRRHPDRGRDAVRALSLSKGIRVAA